MSHLYRVVYCSRNLIPGTAQNVAGHVESILKVSRENNARQGITGALLFNDGCFAQVLEGSADAVEQTFERIQCDYRHSDVVVLQTGPVGARDFSGWSMAFAGVPDARLVNGVGLADALAGDSMSAEDILDILKGVVGRRAEWLTA